MDKNMINIDDLVRQRLSGGEEQERGGAWMNMREMLDREMPVRVPIQGYNWRRMLAAATGLVLLASLTAGSYHFYNTRFHNDNAALANGNADKSTPASGAMQHMSDRAAAEKPVSEIASGNTADAAGIKAVNAVFAPEAYHQPDNNTIRTHINHQPSVQPLKPISHTREQLHANPVGALPHSALDQIDVKDFAKSGIEDLSKVEAADKNASEAGKPAANVTPKELAGTTSGNVPAAKSAPGSAETAKTKPAGNAANQANGHNSPELALDRPRASSADTRKRESATTPLKDTMEQMTIHQRMVINPITRRSKLFMDTISIESIAVDKKALNDLAKQTNVVADNVQNRELMPAASLAMKQQNADASYLVPLASMKVRTQKTNAWNARSFNDVVRDVKFNLSQVRFYPGIILGFNSSVIGSNSINGLHLGITGTFTFGEHWNMMAELKYMHRFNGGSSIHDNYNVVTDSVVVNNQKTYLQNKVEHFFKFSTMQSIEMPIALRYAAGRVNLFGGVNMAYNFRVNVEEVERVYDSSSVVSGSAVNLSSQPGIRMDDFKTRFSVGYLLGIGYQISPSVQLDLRATQNLWDNAGGNGASSVSRQLYRAPSFQFSLGYRFSQRNRIPKAK